MGFDLGSLGDSLSDNPKLSFGLALAGIAGNVASVALSRNNSQSKLNNQTQPGSVSTTAKKNWGMIFLVGSIALLGFIFAFSMVTKE